MDQSYVGMESKECILCKEEYETGSLLLDKRLRKSLDRLNCTGPGLCNTCKTTHTGLPIEEYDHVALIEATNPVYNRDRRGRKRLESAETSGTVCFMRRECYAQMFDVDLGDWEFCMVEPEVMAMLSQMQNGASE